MELDVCRLYRAHACFVERVLRRSGVAERDLGDATQDVFVVVHRRLPEFEGRSEPRTWLYRIAWNVASETRRRAHRRRELLDQRAEPACERPDVAARLESEGRVAALLDAIERLPPDKRAALVAHELDERPMAEVARGLGIPLKTAFSRLYAARRALHDDLRKQGWACAAWWSWPFERVIDATRWRGLEPAVGGTALPSPPLLALAVLGGLTAVLSVQPIAAPVSVAKPATMQAVQPTDVARLEPHTLEPLEVAQPAAETPRPRARGARQPPPTPPGVDPVAALVADELQVVHTGEADLGAGPFGESPLADPAPVAPERHPRAKIAWLR